MASAPANAASSPAAAPPVTSASGGTCSLPGFEQALLARINAARASGATCGTQSLPPTGAVQWNTTLFKAALGHSQDMADRSFFDHRNPDGNGVGFRVTAQGYRWAFVGENIAAGYPSVDAVMNGWLASPGHCENIMNRNAADVAVACVVKPNDPQRYGNYWTMVLAKPQP